MCQPCDGALLRPRLESGAWRKDKQIHALADHQGRPVALAPTPENSADISMAIPLMQAIDPAKGLLAEAA